MSDVKWRHQGFDDVDRPSRNEKAHGEGGK